MAGQRTINCTCDICEKHADTPKRLAYHLSRAHQICAKTYYAEHMGKVFCECGTEAMFESMTLGYRNVCEACNKIKLKEARASKIRNITAAIKADPAKRQKFSNIMSNSLKVQWQGDQSARLSNMAIANKKRTVLKPMKQRNILIDGNYEFSDLVNARQLTRRQLIVLMKPSTIYDCFPDMER